MTRTLHLDLYQSFSQVYWKLHEGTARFNCFRIETTESLLCDRAALLVMAYILLSWSTASPRAFIVNSSLWVLTFYKFSEVAANYLEISFKQRVSLPGFIDFTQNLISVLGSACCVNFTLIIQQLQRVLNQMRTSQSGSGQRQSSLEQRSKIEGAAKILFCGFLGINRASWLSGTWSILLFRGKILHKDSSCQSF